MPVRNSSGRVICASLLFSLLSGCFNPPYNNFREDKSPAQRVATGTAVGIGMGAMAGVLTGYPAIGIAVGGSVGFLNSQYKNSKKQLLNDLQNQEIQYVKYGDTMTLIIPTDHYFVFNSAHLNDICYPGLENVIKLLKSYACSPIYVAAFTDNIGSRRHKKSLSQAQAEAMLTFLWANDIPAQRLHAEGYGDKHDIGDNKLIHGSAYNRRIEIQWFDGPVSPPPTLPYGVSVK